MTREATAETDGIEGNAYDPAPLPPIADVYRWAMDQAAHIRAGRFDLVDLLNVAEEIESVGRTEFRSLVSNLSIVLQHMLKWDHQPAKRTRSWIASIDEHRMRLVDDLADNPSLKARLDEAVARAYRYARQDASKETGRGIGTFPLSCPYGWADIMERLFVFYQE